MKTVLAFAFLIFAMFPVLADGQGFEWLPGGTYDPAIPTPKQYFGYEIGDYLTDNLQMAAYIHKLEELSPRVKVFQYGESVERRKLWIVAVSTPENIARLEEIRSSIARLRDPRTTSPAEAAQIAKNTVPIGWMNYGTDGGETSAFEAGLQVLYQLAAGTDPLTMKILQNQVVIINPALNPDSHQTFVTWAKNMTIRGGTADPAASEHFVAWFASSDGNHFKIDLNRDAFALTQPETQAASKALHHWNPQVWIDNHGEPDEYFMAPFTRPVNNNYPESLKKWAEIVGRNSARYFDRYGWTYAKDENYDLYFPGYWDSYPAFHGAIAATYESNGGGSKGFRWERPDGTIVTLREAVHKHFIADLATLEVLADNREGILLDYYRFFKTGMDEVSTEKFKTYVIHEQDDPGRVSELLELLARHNIEVYRAGSPVRAARAQDYFDRTPRAETFPAGSLVIPLRQPKKRLLKTLFEPDPAMEESFMKDVAARRGRDARLGSDAPKEGAGFYDITAWALPLHFGVATSFTEEEIGVGGMVKVGEEMRFVPSAFDKSSYGYTFSNRTNSGAKLAGKLLQMGYNVAITRLPTRIGQLEIAKGTYIVRTIRNGAGLYGDISRLAREYGTEVKPISSSWGEGGISLGSDYVLNLRKPSIMVATREPTRAVTFGSVYSVLSQRYDLDFSAVVTSMIPRIDLNRYNVIIFPDGSAGGYERELGPGGVEKLRNWIRNGGTFIGLAGGAEFTTREDVAFTDVEMIRTQAGSEAPIETIPGSIFKATVNGDYFLGLGYDDEIAVQFRGSSHMTPTRAGANVAVYKQNGHIMGHIWDTTVENLGGKLYMADVPVGEGRVVLFADDPTFRAYWRGLDRLFINSILISTAY